MVRADCSLNMRREKREAFRELWFMAVLITAKNCITGTAGTAGQSRKVLRATEPQTPDGSEAHCRWRSDRNLERRGAFRRTSAAPIDRGSSPGLFGRQISQLASDPRSACGVRRAERAYVPAQCSGRRTVPQSVLSDRDQDDMHPGWTATERPGRSTSL